MKPSRKSVPAPHVALVIETSKFYGREILRGIGHFMRLNEPWVIYTAERGQDDPDPAWLRQWQGDGIITRSLDLKLCKLAKARGIPVVSLRHLVKRPAFPSFFPDQQKIAVRIAEHFIERGFQNFAYVGVSGNRAWEHLRREHFVQRIRENPAATLTLRPMVSRPGLTWEEELTELVEWVSSLPKPVGIMVNHDTQGIQLLSACRHIGVRVPDEVAVVSVDNDPILCEISTPPLSSIDQNVQTLGFRAAATLAEMMGGRTVANGNYFTEPGQVVVRQSSDITAVEDLQLAKAIRFVRENALKRIDVNAIAKAAGMSRRSLEKKFAKSIGRTPLEEIMELRFRRVRQLLLETDYVLPQIAEMSGFRYQEYMVRFFKKRTQMTPGQFRRKKRFDS